jgi:hypothetical protein
MILLTLSFSDALSMESFPSTSRTSKGKVESLAIHIPLVVCVPEVVVSTLNPVPKRLLSRVDLPLFCTPMIDTMK